MRLPWPFRRSQKAKDKESPDRPDRAPDRGPQAQPPSAAPDPQEPLATILSPQGEQGQVAGTPAQPNPAAGSDPLAGMQTTGQEEDDLDPGLLDIFRDAKSEVEESTLASELEEVPVTDLLSELSSIGIRLGIPPGGRPRERGEDTAAEAAEEGDPVAEDDPPPDGTVDPAREPAASPGEGEAGPPPADREPGAAASGGERPPALEPIPPPWERVEVGPPPVEPPQQESAAEAGPEPSPEGPGPEQPRPRRYVMHALFLLLALGAAATAVSGALGGTDLAAMAEPAPSLRPRKVLGYLRPPLVTETAVTAAPRNGAQPAAPPAAPVAAQAEAEAAPAPEPEPTPTAEAEEPVSEEPEPEPTREPEPLLPPQYPPSEHLYTRYTVQPGDTLSSIADAFGICPDYLIWNNPQVASDLDLLFVGTELIIPVGNGVLYRVEQGDTLEGIAALFGISPAAVTGFAPNGLASAEELRAGMILFLPEALLPSPPPPEPPPGAPYGYIWPWYGEITSLYGEPRTGDYYHPAIDIAGLGYYGHPVAAAASGLVTEAAYDEFGFGYYVIIEHPDGSQTLYGHMSAIYVQEGQWVSQGEAVGALGCSGYSTGTHLHFELWIDGVPVDPLAYLP